MKFTLEIELGNEAMQNWRDIRDAMRELIRKLNTDQYSGTPLIDGGKIMDLNGNSVGKWEIAEKPKVVVYDRASRERDDAAKPFIVYERMDEATAHAKPEHYIVAFESIATGCMTYATTLDPATLGERKKPVVIMRKPETADRTRIGNTPSVCGDSDDSDDPTSVEYQGHRQDVEAVNRTMRPDAKQSLANAVAKTVMNHLNHLESKPLPNAQDLHIMVAAAITEHTKR